MQTQNKYLKFVLGAGDTAPEAIRLAIGASQSDIKESSLHLNAAQSSGGSGGGMMPPASQTGGPGGPSMEARVAVLEANVGHIRSDLSKLADVPARLATIEEKVVNLPSKDWVDGRLNGLLVKAGILFAIFNVVLGAVIKFT